MLCASSSMIMTSCPRDLDERRQVRDVSVHAVHAFEHEQRPTILRAEPGEEPVERRRIVVREAADGRVRQHAALLDADVRLRVVDQQVAISQQRVDGRDVGQVAAGQHQAVLATEEVRQAPLQLLVQRRSSTSRLAEHDVPYWSSAALAAAIISGSDARPR